MTVISIKAIFATELLSKIYTCNISREIWNEYTRILASQFPGFLTGFLFIKKSQWISWFQTFITCTNPVYHRDNRI